MNSRHLPLTLAGALGAALSLSAVADTAPTGNPFAMTDLGQGYMVAEEGKCGATKAKQAAEAKCGAEKAAQEAARKATEEGKCAANKPMPAPAKSEEGKCGDKK